MVPVTREHFTMLTDRDFLKLMRMFGIVSNHKQNVYPRIVGVKLTDFTGQVQMMKDTLTRLLSSAQKDSQQELDYDPATIYFDLATVKAINLLED